MFINDSESFLFGRYVPTPVVFLKPFFFIFITTKTKKIV
jgi:hypothetical protein